MEKTEKLIDLQNAHATQYTDSEGKSVWHVRQNITSNDLYELPGDWSEKQVFKSLHFAREFELIALNAGIQFGKKLNINQFNLEKENLLKVIKDLTASNSRLAEKLGFFIGEEEE